MKLNLFFDTEITTRNKLRALNLIWDKQTHLNKD